MNHRKKFGLKSNATEAEVRAHWQRCALETHPDYGGSVKIFMYNKDLYHKALKESSTPIPCSVCKGSGRKKISSGFHTMEVSCPKCKNK